MFDRVGMESRRPTVSPWGPVPTGQPASVRPHEAPRSDRQRRPPSRLRDAGPTPVTLDGQQLGQQRVSYPSRYIPVSAWVPFTDGGYRQVEGMAVAWTWQAVKVAWRTGEEEPVEHQAWVWAAAVTPKRLSGPHITDDPRTVAYRPPRQPDPPPTAPEQFRPSVQPPRTRPW